MSLFDSIQYPVVIDSDEFIVNLTDIPDKFFLKLSHSRCYNLRDQYTELREIILNWNEDDEKKYSSIK
jgi:hypothetical protein